MKSDTENKKTMFGHERTLKKQPAAGSGGEAEAAASAHIPPPMIGRGKGVG